MIKIKVSKDLYVNLNSLLRFEWRRYYPVLIVHEKFEKTVKWILRIFAAIGIGTSVLTINHWYYSLGLALIIFLIEQFFENSIFEYTTMILQPPPPFEIDYGQWKGNGFMIPKYPDGDDLPYFGPSYIDESYAIKFFKYLKTWINDNSNDDIENNLVVSLIIEPSEEYTTYIYANPGRKRLDVLFKIFAKESQYEKKGKKQQKFIAQTFYWHTLDFKEGYHIKQFLDIYDAKKTFYFTPSVLQPFNLPPKFLLEYSIKKYHLKIKNRKEVNKSEPEYHFIPEKTIKLKDQPQIVDESEDIYRDIEKAFSISEDIGFMPNEGTKVGVINLCFSDPILAYEAYKQLIIKKEDGEIIVTLKENDGLMNMELIITKPNRTLRLLNCNFNKKEFEQFKTLKGGGDYGVLSVGWPPANKRHIVLSQDIQPLIIKWTFLN
jgi:hypothetical protein